MKISYNTTIVDVAYNLSGSLAGVPVVLSQLPVGTPIGFDTLPEPWETVDDIGQTWTPDLQGLELDLSVPLYNVLGQAKAPYSTNINECLFASTTLNRVLERLLTTQTYEIDFVSQV